MLSASDIRHLADKDILKEVEKARLLLFKHRMGVRTGHFKDSHVIAALRKYIARLKTTLQNRKNMEMEIVDTAADAQKKVESLHADIAKRQEIKPKKSPAKKAKKEEKVDETTSND